MGKNLLKMQLLYRVLTRKILTLKSWFFRMHLMLSGAVEVDRSAEISHQAIFQLTQDRADCPQIVIGAKAKIKQYCILGPRNGHIRIGKGTTINPFCVLLGYGGIDIGNNVRIAAGTSIIAFNHNFDNVDIPIASQGNNWKGIKIDDDVWIGTGVKILDGVHISSGCVIGANSTVTKSLPPLSVAVGSPAKVIKMRGNT